MAKLKATSGMSLFNDPLLSDVTIKQTYKGATREYHAHKAILCKGSDFFSKAFSGNFKEATDRVIELHDDILEHFEILLKHLYGISYVPSDNIYGEYREECCITAIRLYTVADKYGVKDLVDIALRYVQDNDFTFIDTECSKTIGAHYDTCGLPGCAMGLAVADKMITVSEEQLARTPECAELIRKYPTFAADMVLVALENVTWISLD
ncbi:BTB/POZ protein [Lophiotrema nucula]|uniref:BTB/POZ protein n=1 Tax=Lophiotrema nucula TaxID=690887 RepID=A0A6A5ZWB1_9PLEO|nr:BTB/POZ protein [Lophiotrema nucula]